MKNPFNDIRIFALIVGLLIGVAFFDFRTGKEQEAIEEIKTRVFPELENSRLDQVTFYNGQETIEFLAREGEWFIQRPQEDKGNDKKIDSFLMSVLEQDIYPVQIEKPINWAKYGLEDPAKYYIQFQTQKGKKHRVQISTKASFDGRYYLKKKKKLFIGHRHWGEFIKKTFLDFKGEKPKAPNTQEEKSMTETKKEI